MFSLIITIAIVGVVVYFILQAPMPQGFKIAIYGVAILAVIFYALASMGIHPQNYDIPVPQVTK